MLARSIKEAIPNFNFSLSVVFDSIMKEFMVKWYQNMRLLLMSKKLLTEKFSIKLKYNLGMVWYKIMLKLMSIYSPKLLHWKQKNSVKEMIKKLE